MWFEWLKGLGLSIRCGTWNSNLNGTLMSKQWRKNCRAQNDATPALDLWAFFYKMKTQFKLKSIYFFCKNRVFICLLAHLELKNSSSKMWFVTYLCVTKKAKIWPKKCQNIPAKTKKKASSIRFKKAHQCKRGSQKLLLKQKI